MLKNSSSSTGMKSVEKALMNDSFMKMTDQMEKSMSGVPHLPQGIIDALVPVIPWLALIGGLLSVFGSWGTISFGLGSSSYYSEWVEIFSGVPKFYFLATGIVSLVSGLLMIWSFKYLKERRVFGWILMAWTTMLSILTMILSLVYSYGSFVGALIGVAISLYLLFEFKPSYKN